MAKRKSKKSSNSKGKSSEVKTISIKLEWVALVILGLLFVVSIVTSGFTNLPLNIKSPFEDILGTKTMDVDELQEKVRNYINDEILQGQATAEVSDFEEDETSEGIYKFTINIEGEEYESFVSKDGRYLYVDRYDMDPEPEEEEIADYPKQDTPDVLLFTMSYCPYGNEAEEFVKPVYDLLGSSMNFEPHYIVSKTSDGGWESLHGEQELNQDVREICTWKYQREKYWDFVLAANTGCDYTNVDSCWEEVAKNVGIDTEQIKTCEANEKDSLLENELALSNQYGATSSPTILINGMNYTGSRIAETFKKSICASFNSEPDSCSQELSTEEGTANGSCD
jgi:glutaredoxin